MSPPIDDQYRTMGGMHPMYVPQQGHPSPGLSSPGFGSLASSGFPSPQYEERVDGLHEMETANPHAPPVDT